MRSALLLLGMLFGASGCVGEILEPGEREGHGASGGSGPGQGTEALECDGVAPDTEPNVVRMLNRREYENTVRDLLGVTIPAIDGFPAEPIVGFDNHAASLVASSALVDKQLEAAEALAQAYTLPPCPNGSDESGCADQFIQSFGRRAYRRPPSLQETAALRELYDTARASGRSHDHGIRLLVEAALQSPQFLYRIETSATATGGVVAADGFELASRLSYFLWASMPDDALLDAAEAGTLADPATLESEVRRMLADPKARATTTAFHELWLELYNLDSVTKSNAVHPDFGSIAPLMRQESTAYAEWAFWESGGSADRLLISDVGFSNDTLAQHYGLPAPGSASIVQVKLGDNGERFGLLTQGAILAHHSNPDRTSPTKRGKFVRQQLLCQPPPPPPDDVPALPTASSSGKSIRDMLAAHVSDPGCAGCHQLMDPIGFGFEAYDTVGRHRTHDQGQPVDDSGELLDVTGGAGKFVGALELAERLTQTEEYYQCVATQWFRFALGRLEGKRDGCSLQAIQDRFRGADDSLPELVVAIALSDAMLHKHTVGMQ